jgi:chromatin segregation and condensation protein Rec8/ScpA/Scc1 (kleisin family)
MQTNAGQLTPNQIAQNLADLARELARIVSAIEHADRDAVQKRNAYDLAFSQAFLAASGSVDARKHEAVVETHRQRLDADLAEALVRHLRRQIDAVKVRIDTGRSVGAAVRAEMQLAGLEGDA